MTLPSARKVLLRGLVPGGSVRLALLNGLVPEDDAEPPEPLGDVFPFATRRPRSRRKRIDEETLLFLLRR